MAGQKYKPDQRRDNLKISNAPSADSTMAPNQHWVYTTTTSTTPKQATTNYPMGMVISKNVVVDLSINHDRRSTCMSRRSMEVNILRVLHRNRIYEGRVGVHRIMCFKGHRNRNIVFMIRRVKRVAILIPNTIHQLCPSYHRKYLNADAVETTHAHHRSTSISKRIITGWYPKVQSVVHGACGMSNKDDITNPNPPNHSNPHHANKIRLVNVGSAASR